MKVVLRDDDVSFFTEPKELKRLFDYIPAELVINLAVIPSVDASTFNNRGGYFWVGENRRLVNFLKEEIKKKRVVIWQHGFSHKDNNEGFELEKKNKRELLNNLSAGKEHLERTFEVVVDTLVPPHDRMSGAAVWAVEKAGFKKICRGMAPLPREIRWYNLSDLRNYFRLALFHLFRGFNKRYPLALTFRNHEEEYFYRIEQLKNGVPDVETLRVTTHHQGLKKKDLLHLRTLLKDSLKKTS